MMNAKNRGLKRQNDGTLVGKANPNAILHTRTYEVEFMEGQRAELAYHERDRTKHVRTIRQQRNQYLLLAGIVGHRKDNFAVIRKDIYIRHGSNLQLRKTTKKGWSLCIKWKDGSTSWERLATLKESNPMEVADYAIAHGIDTKPAFAW